MDRFEEQTYTLIQPEPRNNSFEVSQKPVRSKSETKSIWIASSILIALLFTLIYLAQNLEPTDVQRTKQLSLWSPLLDEIEYVEREFEDEFNSTNIYRGLPTPEREAAWSKLVNKHAIEVPIDKMNGLNQTTAVDMKHELFDESSGYIGHVDVFHQLECLNMIRVYTWLQMGKYPYLSPMSNMTKVQSRSLIDDCIESLRLALQCASDVTPVLAKLGGPIGRKADFHTYHRCRNFDKIEAWFDKKRTES